MAESVAASAPLAGGEGRAAVSVLLIGVSSGDRASAEVLTHLNVGTRLPNRRTRIGSRHTLGTSPRLLLSRERPGGFGSQCVASPHRCAAHHPADPDPVTPTDERASSTGGGGGARGSKRLASAPRHVRTPLRGGKHQAILHLVHLSAAARARSSFILRTRAKVKRKAVRYA